MDIRKKAAADTSTFQLRDGADNLMWDDDAKTVPVEVEVYGPGSKQYQAAAARQQNRSIDVLKKKGKADQSVDDKIAETADFLASITVRFKNLEYDNLSGNALAMAIYSDPTLGFIGQQVQAHSAEWANFTKGLATS